MGTFQTSEQFLKNSYLCIWHSKSDVKKFKILLPFVWGFMSE